MSRTAHIEVDDLHEFIDWMELKESIPLNLANTLAVGKVFLENNLDIIVSYPLGSGDYEFLIDGFGKYAIFCFTLCPRLEIALSNRGDRDLTEQEMKRISYHYESGIAYPQYPTILIDNSDEQPDLTASRIIEHLKRASEPGNGV